MTKLVNENDHSKNNNKGNKLHRSIRGFLSISSVLEQAQEMHQGKRQKSNYQNGLEHRHVLE